MDKEVVVGLISGLIGSIIGGVIGAWATLKASTQSIEGIYKQEIEKREYQKKQQNITVIESLIKELKENLEITKEVLEKGNYKVHMSREAWDINKGQISFMSKKLQGNLPFTYHLIANFNGLINYDFYKLSHGAGYVDEKIKDAASTFKGNAGGVLDQLEESLSALT